MTFKIFISIFDPLGFLIPFTIKSRILIQQIKISEINWDDELQENEFLFCKDWLEDLKMYDFVK